MASPAVTYTFVNGNVADASQVNQNFTDIINSLTDGTKSLNIDALTCAGAFTANGSVDLGNAAADTISLVGTIDTNVTVKSTDATASAGPDIIIDRDSASAADSDAIGRIIFRGNDDAGTPADNDYASIEASIIDSGAGSEDGKLVLKIAEGGTSTAYITAEPTKGVALKGRTDGVAITAGDVGEVYEASNTSGLLTTATNAAVLSVVLPSAGIWLIQPYAELTGSATSCTQHRVSIYTSASARYVNDSASRFVAGYDSWNPGASIQMSFCLPSFYIKTTGSQTLYMYGACVFSGGNMTISGYCTATRV